MAGMDNGQQVIGWDDLDKRKLYVIGPAFSLAVRALLYPPMMIKTRLQVQNSPYNGTVDAFRKVVKHEGFRALYKGFPTNCIGLGVGQVYITTYEVSRKHAARFGFAHGWNNFIAGAAASTVSQFFIVPIDVVSQLQMLQGQASSANSPATTSAVRAAAPAVAASPSSSSSMGTTEQRRLLHTESARTPSAKLPNVAPSGSSASKPAPPKPLPASSPSAKPSESAGIQSARQIAMRLYANEGVRGLYRGYFASICTYVPSSGIWWASYGVFYSQTHGVPVLSAMPVPLVHAVCGGAAGLVASVTTNPLDVVRTRLQVEGSRSGLKTVQSLWRAEGPRWLARGVTARIMSAVPSGAVIITSYETVKRLSMRT